MSTGQQPQFHAGMKRSAPTSSEEIVPDGPSSSSSCAAGESNAPMSVNSSNDVTVISSKGPVTTMQSESTVANIQNISSSHLTPAPTVIAGPLMPQTIVATTTDPPGNFNILQVPEQPIQTTSSTVSTTQQSDQQTQSLTPLDRKNKNLSEKKIRRLEKNRISARNCRRKKKEVALNLQREINILESENLRLRLQLQIGQEAEQLTKEEQDRFSEGLDSLLKSGASDSEIYLNIEDFKEKYADYGRDRRSAIDFHLRNVERLLLPTTTTTVAMRALGETRVSSSAASSDNQTQTGPIEVTEISTDAISANDNLITNHNLETAKDNLNFEENTASSASSSSKATTNLTTKQQKSLFQYLVNYLKVTPAQAAALKDSRHVAKELDSALVKSLSMVQELRETLTQCTDDLDAEFTTIRSILTPRQAAKFLVWVANNDACMHMLNELWRRQYPEPIVDEEDYVVDDDAKNESNVSEATVKLPEEMQRLSS